MSNIEKEAKEKAKKALVLNKVKANAIALPKSANKATKSTQKLHV
ncbi:hypothetical protein ACJJI4_21415 [Microbulbifer sp. TRSA002]